MIQAAQNRANNSNYILIAAGLERLHATSVEKETRGEPLE
jgi:hypothetical protein